MRLMVTFYLDETDEGAHQRLYKEIAHLGGYDVEIEEVENPPQVATTRKKKKK